jgi:hypothetical protein
MAMIPSIARMPTRPGGIGGGLGKEVHVVEGGDAAAQHFGTGQQGACPDEIGPGVTCFAGPDAFVTSQRIRGRSSAKPRKQAHCGMGVEIDQAR